MSKSQERSEPPADETPLRSPAEVGTLNLPLLEALYRDFASDPTSVPVDWRRYFE
ncbi:MAG: 2-oxoglutarate dehydrogenase E1 subunit family protein, partial [Anaerolineales bacterium]